jgi:hypothetical protein
MSNCGVEKQKEMVLDEGKEIGGRKRKLRKGDGV